MSKQKQDSPDVPCDSFEESLERLQEIVNDLESGNFGLDESLSQFETGIGLLRHCYSTLEAAEQKIEMLTGVDSDGNPITKDFDADATYSGEQTTQKKKRKSPAKKKKAVDDTDNAASLF